MMLVLCLGALPWVESTAWLTVGAAIGGLLLGAAGSDIHQAGQAPAPAPNPVADPAPPGRFSDPLTGLANLYGLEEEGVATAFERTTVVVFNLDDLVWINRRFGRRCGDEVLRGAAKALSEVLQGRALVGRLGGDEFLAVVPGGRPEGAATALDGRKALRTVRAPLGGLEDLELSVSVGAAETRLRRSSAFAETLSVAERALDQALARGGDRIIWAEGPERFAELRPELEIEARD